MYKIDNKNLRAKIKTLFLKTMVCFSGCLMSSASLQKLFCGVCSALKCSFEEFVREKVVFLSYSSAIFPSLPSTIVFKRIDLWLPPWYLTFAPFHTSIFFFLYLFLSPYTKNTGANSFWPRTALLFSRNQPDCVWTHKSLIHILLEILQQLWSGAHFSHLGQYNLL